MQKTLDFSDVKPPNDTPKSSKQVIDVREFAQMLKITSGNVIPIKIVRISAHSLRWTWKYTGQTMRKPTNTAKMRGWVKRFYDFGGFTIALNPKTMEIWTESRPYKNVRNMISANWSKTELAAREFSKFAQIAITPVLSDHPLDIQTAHLVIEDRLFSQLLKPFADSEGSKRIGLTFDKSHPNKAELTGKESVEGGIGMDWFFLQFPHEHRAIVSMLSGFDEYNKNIKLHLSVLTKMSKTLDKIARAKGGK